MRTTVNNPLRGGIVVGVVALFAIVPTAAAQFPGLKAGTVTASIDGSPFTATVSVAAVNEEGTLILSNLSNAVQIHIPGAKVSTFALEVDGGGDPIGVILGLKSGERYIT
jgi:hypothetical protein